MRMRWSIESHPFRIGLRISWAANPGARFNAYRLPREAGDAAMGQVMLANGNEREVYVSPQGKVLGSMDPEARICQCRHRQPKP